MRTSSVVGSPSTLGPEVVGIVNKHWESTSVPLPLSRIGQQLGPIASGELEALGASLKNYISENLSEDLRYIENKKYGDFTCPKLPSAGLTDSELIRRYEGRNSNKITKSLQKKFKPDVWRSFITPLEDSDRFLIVSADGSVRSSNTSAIFNPAEIAHLILENDLAFNDDGSRLTYAEARAKIVDWSERNGIDVETLYDTESTYIPPEHLKTKSVVAQKTHAKNHQKLVDFLAVLTDEELRRVSIPADVIYRLLKDS